MRLRCDYDEGVCPPTDGRVYRLLKRAGYGVERTEWYRSPSGKGWHLVVDTDPLPGSEMEVVALQAVLGSDPLREACNVMRARNVGRVGPFWRTRWNVLYRGKRSG